MKDKEGYWTAAYTVSFVTAFSTRQVARAEAPRAHDDFLLPKWKGKMWLNEDDIEWYATMFEIMGKEKATELMRRLWHSRICATAEIRVSLSNCYAPVSFQ